MCHGLYMIGVYYLSVVSFWGRDVGIDVKGGGP